MNRSEFNTHFFEYSTETEAILDVSDSKLFPSALDFSVKNKNKQ